MITNHVVFADAIVISPVLGHKEEIVANTGSTKNFSCCYCLVPGVELVPGIELVPDTLEAFCD